MIFLYKITKSFDWIHFCAAASEKFEPPFYNDWINSNCLILLSVFRHRIHRKPFIILHKSNYYWSSHCKMGVQIGLHKVMRARSKILFVYSRKRKLPWEKIFGPLSQERFLILCWFLFQQNCTPPTSSLSNCGSYCSGFFKLPQFISTPLQFLEIVETSIFSQLLLSPPPHNKTPPPTTKQKY